MILETVEVGQLQVNCYILAEKQGSEAVIIDPGDNENKIRRVLDKHNLQAKLIVNTHGHVDHIGCDDKFGVTVYVHKLDLPLLKDADLNFSKFLMHPYVVAKDTSIKGIEEKELIRLGKIQMEVIHTPGHTAGGICLLLKSPENKILFTGDSLFYRSIGRTDFPGANEEMLISSIKGKIFKLAADTVIYPGHGPSSTIGDEMRHNPFLN